MKNDFVKSQRKRKEENENRNDIFEIYKCKINTGKKGERRTKSNNTSRQTLTSLIVFRFRLFDYWALRKKIDEKTTFKIKYETNERTKKGNNIF